MVNEDFEKAFDAFRSYTSIKYDGEWPVVSVEDNLSYKSYSLSVSSNVLTKSELRTILSTCYIFDLSVFLRIKENMLFVIIEAPDEIIKKFISIWLPKG